MLKDLTALAEVTLGGSVCILLLLALGPVLAKKFSPRWRYWAWLVLAVVLITYPGFQPVWENLFPAPIQLPVPQVVAEWTAPEYDGMAADEADALPYGYQGTVVGEFGGDTTYEVWYTDDDQVEHHLYDFKLFRLEGINGSWSILFRWERIWVAGLTVSLLLLAAGYLRLWRRVKRYKLPLVHGSEERLSELCVQEKIGRPPRLFRVSGLKSPCLVGIVRPAILLPRELPAEALSWALAHELTHLKHRDTWYTLLMTLARCFHWFNPLVWLMVRAARRDMELCCDYDLLCGRDEAARRAYGRAILDQMTGRDRGFSGLTTGFSGSKREVFTCFRAMMDTTPKRKGRALLALAVAAVLLSGSLVACQSPAIPDGRRMLAWVVDDFQEDTVTCYLLDWFGPKELGTESRLLAALEEQGYEALGPAQQVPLAPDATFSCYMGNRTNTYPVIRSTLFAPSGAGVGELCEITVEDGEITHLIKRGSLMAALNGDPMLDFTGYCGEMYAVGMGGVILLSGEQSIHVDPCNELGQDSDHTRYTLPLAEDAQISATDMPFLTGLSSGHYPDLYRLTVVDGEVTAIEGVWPEAENTVTLPIDPEEETPSNPENMPEYDPDFYGESGAEDMPEYDPGFYGESGAQPLEPDGSGMA